MLTPGVVSNIISVYLALHFLVQSYLHSHSNNKIVISQILFYGICQNEETSLFKVTASHFDQRISTTRCADVLSREIIQS